MTDHAQEKLRSYRDYFLKTHGLYYPESDPLLPSLYSIHLEMEQNNQTNREIASRIQEVSSKINPKEFHFYSGDAAWKFQRGITLRWGIIGVLILLFIWIAGWYWSMANKVDQAKTIIGASGKTEELLKQVKKDNEGYYYLDFTAANGNSIQTFKEFQRINSKTVRVYLGKDSK